MAFQSRRAWGIGICLMIVLSLVFTGSAFASMATPKAEKLTQVSSDPYTNKSSQHKTEVEPDTYSYGSTIVSAFQVGRFTTGGSSNIGWATSGDNGKTWTHGSCLAPLSMQVANCNASAMQPWLTMPRTKCGLFRHWASPTLIRMFSPAAQPMAA